MYHKASILVSSITETLPSEVLGTSSFSILFDVLVIDHLQLEIHWPQSYLFLPRSKYKVGSLRDVRAQYCGSMMI